MTRWLCIIVLGSCARIAGATESPTTVPAGEAGVLVDPIQLTDGFDRAGEAYFSPDMHWIIFQATPPGGQHYQMYVARLKRSADSTITGIDAPIRISPENSRNTCGFFSPDGRSIIFGSTSGKEDPNEPSTGYQREGRDYRWAYPAGMEIFRADDWAAAVAGAGAGGQVDLARNALTNNSAYDAECAFSPDGKWIVFSSNRIHPTPLIAQPTTAEVTADLELFAMRADGSGVVRLTRTPGYDGGPFFSPDGKHVVYRSDRKGNNLLQVFTARIVFDDAGNIVGLADEQQLTQDANVNWGPYWHPDGKQIVYSTSAHGHTNYELYLIRRDGSKKVRLTHAAGADVLPVFSPDGKYLMWASKRNGKTTQVWLARFVMPGEL